MRPIEPYLGQSVTVALRDTMPSRIKGLLKECDGTVAVLQRDDNKPDLIIPLTSILYIEPFTD